jgi:RNA polymerase sigma-70 factor, ECF subfamily
MSANATPDPDELLHLARMEDSQALGQLLELYRGYLALLARLQVGRRLQGKVDASDLVQETFLEAYRHFPRFHGTSERELVAWLRQILAARRPNWCAATSAPGAATYAWERELAAELDQSSRVLDRGLVNSHSSPSQQADRREQAVLLAEALRQLPEDYRLGGPRTGRHHRRDRNSWRRTSRRTGRKTEPPSRRTVACWHRLGRRPRPILGGCGLYRVGPGWRPTDSQCPLDPGCERRATS